MGRLGRRTILTLPRLCRNKSLPFAPLGSVGPKKQQWQLLRPVFGPGTAAAEAWPSFVGLFQQAVIIALLQSRSDENPLPPGSQRSPLFHGKKPRLPYLRDSGKNILWYRLCRGIRRWLPEV